MIPEEIILRKIYLIRGQKVMLDEDLAELYQVETKRLNEQVKRNHIRFPEDFMFILTNKEFANLKSQNATSRWGGRRTPPYAFTEFGVLMLSSILNSEMAIQINIHIVRVYSKIREILLNDKDVMLRIEQLERRFDKHDEKIELLFTYFAKLIEVPPRTPIGFKS
jgi:ORF6N domain